MSYLLPFSSLTKADLSVAGGKGANLGELTRSGIPVPPGSVLTAQAYRLFLSRNGIHPKALMAEGGPALVRSRILEGTIPEEIWAELEPFKNARIAVRSSATAEDLEDASFAGQQETFLNVMGETALKEALLGCYASLWGDRAVEYRQHQGYAQADVALALVLQEMVESTCAGVLFTRSPSGKAEEMLINASYGLGEAVVSGMVTPDEYRVRRDGTLAGCHIGSKEKMVVYSGAGTRVVPVPPEKRALQALDASQIARLARLGLDIEAHYGHPMDIEWAFSGSGLYILQARAITAEGPVLDQEELSRLPHVAPARGRMRESVLFNMEKTPRAYTPLDHDFAGIIGQQKAVLFDSFGIRMEGETFPMDDDGLSTLSRPKAGLNRRILHLPSSLKALLDHPGNLQKAEEALQNAASQLQAEKNTESTVKALGLSLERLRSLVSSLSLARFRYAMFPSILLGRQLSGLLSKAEPPLSSYDLVEGLSYVTADITRSLSEMAGWIRSQPGMTQAVLERDYAELLQAYPELAQRFQSFMDLYGAKSDFNCYCFAARSFHEDPERFLQILRPILRSQSQAVPTLQEGLARHEKRVGALLSPLPEKRREKARCQIEWFRAYHQIRERSQYLWESAFFQCRCHLRTLSGLLDVPYDDLTFLFAQELSQMCRAGALDESCLEKIQRRRSKRPLAEAYWSRCMTEALGSGSEISGICGSSGQATGRVCLVHGPEEFDRLMPGDILVCPYTDPEWTPLFSLASGVIVDTGGTLSHAAIVAREYGIPALLAAGNATRSLPDGARVMLNATAGTVTILES